MTKKDPPSSCFFFTSPFLLYLFLSIRDSLYSTQYPSIPTNTFLCHIHYAYSYHSKAIPTNHIIFSILSCLLQSLQIPNLSPLLQKGSPPVENDDEETGHYYDQGKE